MAEKRIFGRFKRRLPVRCQGGVLEIRGVTGNISATGLSVLANRVAPTASQLSVEVTLPSGVVVTMVSEVMWSRAAPPGAQGIVMGQMGVRFIGAPAEAFYDYLVECDAADRAMKK